VSAYCKAITSIVGLSRTLNAIIIPGELDNVLLGLTKKFELCCKFIILFKRFRHGDKNVKMRCHALPNKSIGALRPALSHGAIRNIILATRKM
jgi:hypothetical protein